MSMALPGLRDGYFRVCLLSSSRADPHAGLMHIYEFLIQEDEVRPFICCITCSRSNRVESSRTTRLDWQIPSKRGELTQKHPASNSLPRC
jgi:hypothetical protein